jgi:hypothetical protein
MPMSLGIGLHCYHDAKGQLPPGNRWTYGREGGPGRRFPDGTAWPTNPPNRSRGTMQVFLLPFIEQDAVDSQLNFAATGGNMYNQSVGGSPGSASAGSRCCGLFAGGVGCDNRRRPRPAR